MSEPHESRLIPYGPRQIGDEVVQTVDGRDIHDFLGLARDYSDWVKRQIKRAKLVENRDYAVFYPHVENPKGGRPSVEYHFTFNGATHIAMMSSAEKGYEVREYFIAKEKELRALQEEENQHPLVRQARAIARLEVRQEQTEQRVAALEAHEPPIGKLTIHDWLQDTGKRWVGKDLRKQMHAKAKQLETPEPFTPKGARYPWYYFSPATIEAAWGWVTRQMTFLRDPGVKYRTTKNRSVKA